MEEIEKAYMCCLFASKLY
ncbi:hypothetical protein Pint_09745 [Pistacia integerrima]|uniref:Uncharacterized protein n=1 Tax=Pistacia integerrima TaxID=434235 RepID=A0ACC0XG86_9ROSI|nr:hypothetical protein Pint_09745 [Pistacia integerrima]